MPSLEVIPRKNSIAAMTDSAQLAAWCQAVQEVVRRTAIFLAEELGRVGEAAIEHKALNNLVSYVDQQAEQRLTRGLQEILPTAVFLTEEATIAASSGEWRWIIDPLDGTTNFLHQLPCFAISVALEHHGQVVLGVVHEVSRQETFYAWRNGGAYLNGRPIKVSNRPVLAQSLVATGFPYYVFDRLPAYLEVFSWMVQHTRGVRRWGAAAVDLAYVAAGRYDLFFEFHLQPWDVAAGLLLVEEAGGLCTDFNGAATAYTAREVLAGNPQVHAEALPRLQASFYPPSV